MQKSLVIVGGGATGLLTALLAAKAGERVTVLEGGSEFGGLLGTFPIAGNRLEFFYHHFFTHDAELAWLVKELGIADKLEFLPATMGVFRDGVIHPFNGPRDLLRFQPLSFFSKIRFGLASLYLGKLAKWQEMENVPALSWFYRWAGRSATDAIWKPMLAIKFGPFADQVPIAWMVGRIRQRMNSRHKGDERLGYVNGSLQTVLDALLQRLRALGVNLVLDARIESFLLEDRRIAGVQTAKGKFTGDRVISTIPTPFLVPMVAPINAQLASELGRVEYFGAVCTVLELDGPLSSTYWLNVADPGFPFGGVIEHTNLIAPPNYQGRHLVYLSRYFEQSNALATASREEIADLMVASLPRIYPHFSQRKVLSRHVFRTLTAATVCDLNFSAKVPSMRTRIPGLYLASMAHVYPDERSLNNSMRVAAEACRVMGITTHAEVPSGSSLSGQLGTT